MKRGHIQQESFPVDFISFDNNFDVSLESPHNGHITPPPEDIPMPSKVRRQGSKIISILRSLTNSVSGASNMELSPPTSPPSIRLPKKVSLSVFRMPVPPTVVHRVPAKGRPSIKSAEIVIMETSPETSPSTSAETCGNSGKSSVPENRNNSTGKTSQDSKFSALTKLMSGLSQQHSENKTSTKLLVGGGSSDNSLEPIQELEVVEVAPEPVPTVITVEKAAAAKIFFECHYNELFSTPVSPRSIRRRELEGALYEDIASSPLEKEAKRKAWARRETDHLREVRAMRSRSRSPQCGDQMASTYEVVKVLGKGSFGVVRLVREKGLDGRNSGADGSRKDVYAMKVIRKSDMLRNSQEGHLRAERDFLVNSEGSRWIVPLIASFQDVGNLYLVMEYMPGGDFLGLLIRDNILSESVTKWYIAEMILCIEEAHSLRWIHRDIKPDNFLISASGHLKISDFGLAFDGHWSHDQSYYNNHRYSLLTKLGITVDGDSIDKKEGRGVANALKLSYAMMGGKERHQKKSSTSSDGEGLLNWRNRTGNRTLARSVVGTSQYMAPEVVKGELYDARCDWWSLAVILYECLYGHTPFLAEEGGRAQTKLNIVSHKSTFSFPSKPPVSSRCQDLIRRIIQDKPDRLCSKRYKSKDVSVLHRDYAGRYVYPNDAEEIKAHRWFKDIQWERMHLISPPFVPNLRTADDTHYFDEEDPISDFSSSQDEARLDPPTEAEVDDALRCFNREIQILARSYVATSYDSIRLRRIEREIETFNMADEQKDYLRGFVRAYGRKERKRPRDRLLRDRDVAGKVLEVRKRGAFLGYSYRRIRRGGSVRLVSSAARAAVFGRGKGGGVWHRGRMSIF